MVEVVWVEAVQEVVVWEVVWSEEEVQAAVVFVATKVAARIYRNPSEFTVESFGEASHTYVDPRILTGDERAQLRRARSARVVRGPIQTLGTPSA